MYKCNSHLDESVNYCILIWLKSQFSSFSLSSLPLWLTWTLCKKSTSYRNVRLLGCNLAALIMLLVLEDSHKEHLSFLSQVDVDGKYNASSVRHAHFTQTDISGCVLIVNALFSFLFQVSSRLLIHILKGFSDCPFKMWKCFRSFRTISLNCWWFHQPLITDMYQMSYRSATEKVENNIPSLILSSILSLKSFYARH